MHLLLQILEFVSAVWIGFVLYRQNKKIKTINTVLLSMSSVMIGLVAYLEVSEGAPLPSTDDIPNGKN